MKIYLYTRLISQHVYVNLYSRLKKLNLCRNYLNYRRSIITLLFNRFQPNLCIYRLSNWSTQYSRSKYSPWFMLSGVSCHFWNNKGISEEEIWETVNDFDLLFTSINSSKNNGVDFSSSPQSTYTPSSTRKETPKLNNCLSSLDSDANYSNDDDDRSSDEDNEMNISNHDIEDIESTKKLLSSKGWEAIILRDDFQVWRREINSNGLYQYKVFGTFTDVPAQAFFTVQRDLDYRKKWDQLVIKLEVVDKQNGFKKARNGYQLSDSGNEVIHWVMHYPFPMYSRDYCYVRRAIIDYKNNIMVLVSRAVDHPNCPVSNKYVRVSDYESQMVIKPHKTFNENGFDYMLTYFDDPRSAFPNPAYNWMAASGVPNFVESLHKAALQLNENRKERKSTTKQLNNRNITNTTTTTTTGTNNQPDSTTTTSNNNNNNSNNNAKSNTNNTNNSGSSNGSKNCNNLNNLYIQCISFKRPQQEKN